MDTYTLTIEYTEETTQIITCFDFDIYEAIKAEYEALGLNVN